MKNSSFLRLTVLFAFALCLASPKAAFGSFDTFSVGGNADTASIQPTVDSFRATLGGVNNGNAPGPLGSGRREINWDGGGSSATTMTGTPLSAFQNTRGALFTTPGTGFVQAPPSGFDTTFGNPTYSSTFSPFSQLWMFSAIGSNIIDVLFFVPGSGGAAAATVSGFGAVFLDVDLANTTQLQFFDIGNNLIFNASVPAASVASGGLSFLGGIANAGEQISRVRITTGNSALGPNDGGGVDVVALDDFIYAEPIPEPSSMALLGMLLLSAYGVALAGRTPLVRAFCHGSKRPRGSR